MTFVAQPRQAFACARGRGKTWVMVIVTGFSLGSLILIRSLIQPFAKSHLFTQVNHMTPCSVFMARSVWVEFLEAKLKATISLDLMAALPVDFFWILWAKFNQIYARR